jgi:hypothetical protein
MNYLGFDPRKTIDPILEHEIRLRAYDFYCGRGKKDGHALDDWLRAEREILRAKRPNRIADQATKP